MELSEKTRLSVFVETIFSASKYFPVNVEVSQVFNFFFFYSKNVFVPFRNFSAARILKEGENPHTKEELVTTRFKLTFKYGFTFFSR